MCLSKVMVFCPDIKHDALQVLQRTYGSVVPLCLACQPPSVMPTTHPWGDEVPQGKGRGRFSKGASHRSLLLGHELLFLLPD